MKLAEHKFNALMLIGAISLIVLFSLIIQGYHTRNESVKVSISQAFNDEKIDNLLIISAINANIKNINTPIFVDKYKMLTNPLAYMTFLRNENMVKELLDLGADPNIALSFLIQEKDSQSYLKSMITEMNK